MKERESPLSNGRGSEKESPLSSGRGSEKWRERERDLYPMEGGVKKRVEENKNKLSEIKRESSIQWRGSGKESRVE